MVMNKGTRIALIAGGVAAAAVAAYRLLPVVQDLVNVAGRLRLVIDDEPEDDEGEEEYQVRRQDLLRQLNESLESPEHWTRRSRPVRKPSADEETVVPE